MTNESTFDFKQFIEESKQTLLKPADYFAGMKTSGGLTEPIIKAVIYGAVAGILGFIWSLLHLGGVGGGIFGSAVGIMILVWAVVGAVIGLFIGGVVMLVLSAIAKGNTDFEANARVTAALMVLMPVRALFGVLSGVNFYLGMIVSLLISLYGIYMIYHALAKALKANEGSSKIVAYVLVALLVLFTLIGMGARKKAARFMEGDFDQRTEKMMKEFQDKAEKALEEMEKNAE
jgi:hypothetical protein